jgi:AcrR family transcriptional regulator
VPTDYTGAGDPEQVLRLLWRQVHLPRRGPRPALTVDAVVSAAVELADSDGLEGLTIRAVAAALRVAPMTVYTYVPGKAELLDLMVDAGYAELPLIDTDGLPWRERLRQIARENQALYQRHPWTAQVSTARPPLGPGLMAKYEHELAAFDDLGLDELTTDAALTFLLEFVRSCAVQDAAVRAMRAGAGSGGDDERWWAATGPVLAELLDETRYPRAVRIGGATGAALGAAYEPEHAFEFGLARVLDGLAALIDE